MQTDDPEIQCPYNPSHLILKSRMQAHIVKCKKNYPLADKMVCPFNAVHHVDKPDYQYHVTNCPDRHVIEGHKYEIADRRQHGNVDGAIYQQPNLPPSEENWDSDVPINGYNPNEHLENVPVLRMLQGATKSERKAFRLQERQRMQRLMEGEQPPSDTSSSSQSTGDGNMAPLRLPRQTSEALRLMNPNMGMGRGGGGDSLQDRNPGVCMVDSNSGTLATPLGLGRGRHFMN